MVVLGIHDGTHDAGAAVVADGVLVAACSEERFTREKGAGGWPARSIAACLAQVGEADVVAFPGFVNPNPALRGARVVQRRFKLDGGWFYKEDAGPLGRLSEWLQFQSPFPNMRSDGRAARALAPALRALLRRDSRGLGGRVDVHDHHRCHAATAYATGGQDDALVIVADGVGDGLALTVWRGRDGALQPLATMPYPHSYGLLYATITGFCGFRPFRHEGKITGLAALGNADAVDVPFPFEGPVTDRRFTQRFGAPLRPWLARLRPYRREDVAAWLQRGVEAELAAIAAHWLRETGLRHVALAGGLFANVRLNQRLAALDLDTLWVFPHMGDGGLAAGAALLSAGARPYAMADAFLGPPPEDPEPALRAAGVRYRRCQDLEEQVAERLAAGRIVARFEGAMEYGPRALGHRSILASGADPRMTDRLNLALSRSEFMPFAPAMLAEEADAWVDGLAPVRRAAAFMTVTAQARANLAAGCPAAVHADGSLRPQLVSSGSLHRVLRRFHALTGVPAVVNTSFNLHEEPIVRTAAEAVETWRKARIDALAIGEFLVEAA
ncbi:MAG: carbamoyltransferase C-terminal domain-containing protein [Myxococcota bacterium]